MLKAKDFRYYAREALRGRWLKAGATGIVAGLLGASMSVGSYVSSYSSSATEINNIFTVEGQIPASVLATVMGILLVFVVWAIVIFIIGGATTLGYAKYNLNIVDDNDPKFKDIFSQYHRIGNGFGMQFFRGLLRFSGHCFW